MNTLIFVSVLFITQPIKVDSYKVDRIVLYTSAALDIITTRAAIINGAREGNPLLTPLVGKKPSTLKLVGVKLTSIGIIELTAKYLHKKGYPKLAKLQYHFASFLWFYASGFNLRFVWK